MNRPAFLDAFAFVDPGPPHALYAYAPVYRVRDARGDWVVKRTGLAHSDAGSIAAWTAALRADGVDVVAPASGFAPNPRLLADGHHWVVYPFVDGRTYTGDLAEIAAAGRLLGRLHASDVPETADLKTYPRPVSRSASWIDEHAAKGAAAMAAVGIDAAAFLQLVEARAVAIEPLDRLPLAGCSFDFKASNLVYAPHPVLVDPDHAARLPRLYDLAVAMLLFHNDLASAPHRLWTQAEWLAFVDAYLAIVPLEAHERVCWPDMLRLAWLDQGVWLIGNFPEGWSDPAEARYLDDLATANLTRFVLP